MGRKDECQQTTYMRLVRIIDCVIGLESRSWSCGCGRAQIQPNAIDVCMQERPCRGRSSTLETRRFTANKKHKREDGFV